MKIKTEQRSTVPKHAIVSFIYTSCSSFPPPYQLPHAYRPPALFSSLPNHLTIDPVSLTHAVANLQLSHHTYVACEPKDSSTSAQWFASYRQAMAFSEHFIQSGPGPCIDLPVRLRICARADACDATRGVTCCAWKGGA